MDGGGEDRGWVWRTAEVGQHGQQGTKRNQRLLQTFVCQAQCLLWITEGKRPQVEHFFSKCPSETKWGQSSIWPWRGWELESTGDRDNRWLCCWMLVTTRDLLAPDGVRGEELEGVYGWPPVLGSKKIVLDFWTSHHSAMLLQRDFFLYWNIFWNKQFIVIREITHAASARAVILCLCLCLWLTLLLSLLLPVFRAELRSGNAAFKDFYLGGNLQACQSNHGVFTLKLSALIGLLLRSPSCVGLFTAHSVKHH